MDSPFAPLDFDEFHLVDLPARLARGNGALAARHLVGARPLAFRIPDGRAYTYTATSEGIDIVAGDDTAHTVVALSEADWSDFTYELKSCFALLYGDRLQFPRGSFGHLARWDPPLRAAFDGQHPYDLEHPDPVLDRQGQPLDLYRSFTLDDSDEEMADFLQRAGWLHVTGVLSAAEVDALNAEVDTALSEARPDDQRSWWTTVEGRDACNRINYLNDRSAIVAGLDTDPRLVRIAALGGDHLRPAADRLDGHGVVIKVPGADSGLADLPWHRDCGMGGHPVKCPMLNMGLQLDAATAEAGQLHMIAGSHLGTSRLPTDAETAGLPTVALDTHPGDVTIHFGHVLHAAPAPARRTGRGRRALYLSFVPPITFATVPLGKGYNDVLFTRDSGHVHHVDEFN